MPHGINALVKPVQPPSRSPLENRIGGIAHSKQLRHRYDSMLLRRKVSERPI
jgi:hypothetical protein